MNLERGIKGRGENEGVKEKKLKQRRPDVSFFQEKTFKNLFGQLLLC